MKMSFRDRMVLSVLIFIIAAGIGGFTIIKPEIQKVAATSLQFEAKLQEKAEVDEKLATKADVEDAIKLAYKKGKNVNEFFLPEMKTHEIDKYLTPIFIKNNVTIKSLKMEEAEAISADFYTYELFNVQYDLGTAGDINESRLHAVKGDTQYAVTVGYAPESLIVNKVTYGVLGAFEDYLLVLDDIDALDKSVVVVALGSQGREADDNDANDEFVIYVFQLSELQEPKL